MADIAMVGLGAMGAPMARNLLAAGHALKVYDVVDTAMDGLLAAGARAATPHDVARDVDAVITMLRTGAVVEEVLTGDTSLFASARRGTLFIDSSTIDVASARRLSARAHAAGMSMVDAPVSGGVPGAEAGTLTFMVGGDPPAVDSARPILEAMGRSIVHVGPPGNGQAAKICNNMILGISMIAVAEAFRLAGRLGVDAQTLQQIVTRSSGDCWVVHHNHPLPDLAPGSASDDGYRPGFSSALMLKDLQLGQQAARECGACTPLGARAAALYERFVNEGSADLDFGAIIRQIDSGES
ncbi:MAG: 3-hydroxyisobutyrate dehydrogenase [Phycisphaeraceae bacterium]|nr:3-hydroxyisobutyrate dehydrogenase [Phycisphaeraceae bacterium]